MGIFSRNINGLISKDELSYALIHEKKLFFTKMCIKILKQIKSYFLVAVFYSRLKNAVEYKCQGFGYKFFFVRKNFSSESFVNFLLVTKTDIVLHHFFCFNVDKN